MPSTIQDQSITITHKGKFITWRPRDQTLPTPASTLGRVEAEEPAVLPVQEGDTRRKSKFKFNLKNAGKKVFRHMHMAKRKYPTNAVKNAALLSASSASEESVLNNTIENSSTRSSRPFSESDDSLPEDGQYPSPERVCFPIHEDLEDVSDFAVSPSAEGISGLSTCLPKARDELTSLDDPELVCSAGVDLKRELKDAIESSLQRPIIESEGLCKPKAPAPDKVEKGGECSEISSTESFSRTRVSLSSNDSHSAPSNSFDIEKPYSCLGSDFVDVEDYLVQPSGSFPKPTYPTLNNSATTEDFGFRPTCAGMPGSWSGICSQEFSKEISATSRPWQDMSKIPTNSPDQRSHRSFFARKEDVLKFLERSLFRQPDASLSFAKCRPILSSFRQSLPSLSLSQSTTGSDSSASVHMRGGEDPDRFGLLRPVGKGKLIGNAERGQKFLNEQVQVSDCYFVGGWGVGVTWREVCEKMEKRVEKRKEIEKVEAEERDEERSGGFKALFARAKGWVDSVKGENRVRRKP